MPYSRIYTRKKFCSPCSQSNVQSTYSVRSRRAGASWRARWDRPRAGGCLDCQPHTKTEVSIHSDLWGTV